MRILALRKFPSFFISSGTQEAIKWLAVISMTNDHINKYIFHEHYAVMFAFGRLAMPLFAFLLAYNLAKMENFDAVVFRRIYQRLSIAAVVSSVPFILLGSLVHGWYPLNILFLLLIGVTLIFVLNSDSKHKSWFAFVLFFVGGFWVEFWWFGLAMFVASYFFVRSPSYGTAFALFVSTLSLTLVNQNSYALLALPVIAFAPLVRLNVPRFKHFLYVYYPLHLSVILIVRQFVL